MGVVGENAIAPSARAGAGWQLWLRSLLAAPWVRYLLFTLIALLYGASITYFIVRGTLFDFNVYYIAAYGFEHGADIYAMAQEPHTTNLARWQELADAAGVKMLSIPYLYPPLTAQLIVPLLRFDEATAGLIWLTVLALAFLLSIWLLGRMWTQPEGASLAYLLMLGFGPPLNSLREGQVEGLLLLAVTVGIVALARRNWFVTGSALAIGTLLKIVPLALCLYLAWRKELRAAIAAALVLVLLLATVPLMFGPDVLPSYLRNYAATTYAGELFTRASNQALSGFLARSLSFVLDATSIYRLYLASALLVVAATIALCWPMRTLPIVWRYEVGLIICAVLLIPTYTWYHMVALAIIPLLIVAESLWRRQLWLPLALVLILYLGTDINGYTYNHIRNLPFWLTCFPFALVACLWGLLAWMIVGERRAQVYERA